MVIEMENEMAQEEEDPEEGFRFPDGLPRTVAVTQAEGGLWIPFDVAQNIRIMAVHAIMFEDGTVWDAINGFRPEKENLEFVRKASGGLVGGEYERSG